MCVGEPQKQREQPEPGDGDTQTPNKLLRWVFISHPHNRQLLGQDMEPHLLQYELPISSWKQTGD